MPSDRTVLEHLLEGRDALQLEVKRLTIAIEELDSVIARIGGAERRVVDPMPAPEPATTADLGSQGDAETVNSQAEIEPDAPAPRKAPAAKKSTPITRPPVKASAPRARKAPAKKLSAPARAPEAPKSIRVHVLEMLAAENRDFGLAEIIDRIHAEGISAHDDAVRSITIKLMKDGRVERVGRGLYRLAGRTAELSTAVSAPTGPAVDSYVPPLDLGQSWQRPGS